MNSKQTKEFMKALDAIVAEKGIDKAIVIEAMEAAMANAYKKNEGMKLPYNIGKFKYLTDKLEING